MIVEKDIPTFLMESKPLLTLKLIFIAVCTYLTDIYNCSLSVS